MFFPLAWLQHEVGPLQQQFPNAALGINIPSVIQKTSMLRLQFTCGTLSAALDDAFENHELYGHFTGLGR
ncbi:hypothetical protein Fuma_02767 [Fuerstiella marisgermanici]|uniref:Uncharacterized protein n=1 Tax=Fuerstiella marisgermanici TaxID=1891926 RepID=A0A1P8WGE9_9PLAN|nr:hypothetical protein Fuma_02767 [Fuerstiella marisgermanici]